MAIKPFYIIFHPQPLKGQHMVIQYLNECVIFIKRELFCGNFVNVSVKKFLAYFLKCINKIRRCEIILNYDIIQCFMRSGYFNTSKRGLKSYTYILHICKCMILITSTIQKSLHVYLSLDKQLSACLFNTIFYNSLA